MATEKNEFAEPRPDKPASAAEKAEKRAYDYITMKNPYENIADMVDNIVSDPSFNGSQKRAVTALGDEFLVKPNLSKEDAEAFFTRLEGLFKKSG